ncbi:MAG: ATPase domain-containing protein [Candidatus Bathyarchaeia archaeon]
MERGLYASFAETRETLIKNLSRHLGVDFEKLEAEGKIKILDLTVMKGDGVTTVLESILDEVKALKAERLVIDSFSAILQAFKDPTEVRIFIQTVLGRIIRGMGCTTIMVEEKPMGKVEMGWGIEEFVADGALKLSVNELDKRFLRTLEILKLRGTKIFEHKLVFTLEKGFKAFLPFIPKPIEKPNRFKPIPSKLGFYSTGVKDLDEVLGGGIPQGSSILLKVSEKIPILGYHLIMVPLTVNFLVQGMGNFMIPSSGVNYDLVKSRVLNYGLSIKEFEELAVIIEPKIVDIGLKAPNLLFIEGEDLKKDLTKTIEIVKEVEKRVGKPSMGIIGADTLVTLYGERGCEKILNIVTTLIRESKSMLLILAKGISKELISRISHITDIYLCLIREHGCLLFYGVKPRTGFYAVEMDMSKDYPLPKLTPIV